MIFDFLQVYISWFWFHVLSFRLGFWVSIRVIVCATCIGHIVLHATSIAIVKKFGDLLQNCQFYVGCGFWFPGCQFFAIFYLVCRFLHYLVLICLN